MQVMFEKWHGAKNDFIVLWATKNQLQYLLDALRRTSPKLCQRDGSGIGADGIIVCEVNHLTQAIPEQVYIINRDGSLAGNCGNGLRCAAMSSRLRCLADTHAETPTAIELRVDRVNFWVNFLNPRSSSDPCALMTIREPLIDEAIEFFDDAKIALSKNLRGLCLERWHLVHLGNLHLVLILEKMPSPTQFHEIASFCQEISIWDGINVHFVTASPPTTQQSDICQRVFGAAAPEEQLQVLIWERGVGPTQACGSGAAAVACAYLEDGLTTRNNWVPISMPGGDLFAKQADVNEDISLAGSAEQVFTGTLEV